ncbi:MAG: thiamine pyrophosphate-dependent enzyme [Pseudomonadota bacterium]
MERLAADAMVESLAAHGLDRLFCVPGESYLTLLDALVRDGRVQVVACRHEGGAGFMAVGDAKVTGKPGVVAVSRGPGATNASIAVHLAEQDAVPLLVLIGQVARFERGRGAFQEVDYGQMFGGIAKGVWEVSDGVRLSETIARALQVAQSGTPGPVVVALPEDMLADRAGEGTGVPPLPVPHVAPSADEIDRVTALLARAERPLLIAGGALSHPEGRAALAAAAKAHQLPVALTFKHQEIFDNASPLYAGYLGFKIAKPVVEAMAEADLILAVGTRLGDTPTQGYVLPKAPVPDQPLVHVYPDPAALGRVFRTDVALPADPTATLHALAARDGAVSAARHAWVSRLNAQARAFGAESYTAPSHGDGLDFGVMVRALAERAPRDSIVASDAGNFSSWVHRLWPWDGTQIALGAVGGAMGLGLPGAIAACLRYPEKKVFAFLGDGGAMMTGAELATARAVGAKPIVVISNNRSYGTIRLHQERDYPHRTAGTDLMNPDFAAWGASFGALGLSVSTAEEAARAADAALAHDGPVVIEVESSLEAISAYTTITTLRAGR